MSLSVCVPQSIVKARGGTDCPKDPAAAAYECPLLAQKCKGFQRGICSFGRVRKGSLKKRSRVSGSVCGSVAALPVADRCAIPRSLNPALRALGDVCFAVLPGYPAPFIPRCGRSRAMPRPSLNDTRGNIPPTNPQESLCRRISQTQRVLHRPYLPPKTKTAALPLLRKGCCLPYTETAEAVLR